MSFLVGLASPTKADPVTPSGVPGFAKTTDVRGRANRVVLSVSLAVPLLAGLARRDGACKTLFSAFAACRTPSPYPAELALAGSVSVSDCRAPSPYPAKLALAGSVSVPDSCGFCREAALCLGVGAKRRKASVEPVVGVVEVVVQEGGG